MDADNLERAGMIELDVMVVANLDDVSNIHSILFIRDEKRMREVWIAVKDMQNVSDRRFD